MRHPLPPLVLAVAFAAAACGSSSPSPPTTPATVTKTVTQTPSSPAAPSPTPAPMPAPAPTPTPTPAPTPTPTPISAATVVEEYYAAINRHDYRTAWNLGGSQFTSDYNTFANDFAGTAYDTLTVTGTQGDTVSIHLDAAQSDGSVKSYEGTYTARNGVLVGASIHQVNAVPPPASGVIRPPNGGYYSEGEYCPDSDAGLTTVDASGSVLTCVYESGRYHWH